jgi:hypothetical protein
MDEGRKRVVAIMTSILVARHMKHLEENTYESKNRTSALISRAVEVAEKIMRDVDKKLPNWQRRA